MLQQTLTTRQVFVLLVRFICIILRGSISINVRMHVHAESSRLHYRKLSTDSTSFGDILTRGCIGVMQMLARSGVTCIFPAPVTVISRARVIYLTRINIHVHIIISHYTCIKYFWFKSRDKML